MRRSARRCTGASFRISPRSAPSRNCCLLSVAPAACATAETRRTNRRRSASEAAGWPFFGQFVAHDITADRSAPQAHADLSQLRNARSPRLNLEGLYGDGPVGHPFLFQRDDPAKLLTAPGGRDLLRNTEGTAIIGDPRNDSHVVMSQMHLAFVHAHNAFVDRARASGQPEARVFDAAARELRLALSDRRAAGVPAVLDRRRAHRPDHARRSPLLSAARSAVHPARIC